MRLKYRGIVVVVLSLLMNVVVAQDGAGLITDRPDFTESAVVVARGSLQLESGVTWQRAGSQDQYSGPELLARWGLAPRLELRIGFPDYQFTDDQSGLGDASLGFKYQPGPAGNWDLGIIGAFTLPIGEETFTADGIDPLLLVAIGRDVTDNSGIGMQMGARWLTQPESMEWLATLVVGKDLSTSSAAFLELAASGVDSQPVDYLLHHGYTLALKPGFQLDIHGALGLSDSAPDFLFGAGWSTRL